MIIGLDSRSSQNGSVPSISRFGLALRPTHDIRSLRFAGIDLPGVAEAVGKHHRFFDYGRSVRNDWRRWAGARIPRLRFCKEVRILVYSPCCLC